ncbi:MAG TPA: hypothetical protein VG298_08750 [Acidimicrobiales bacterium]|nr:hypothetical protein [Acidimicrobiales bacterium]
MSAMPARITERPQGTVPTRLPAPRTERRADRRAAQMEARRERRRWSIFSCAVLAGAFALTVGILDVLH